MQTSADSTISTLKEAGKHAGDAQGAKALQSALTEINEARAGGSKTYEKYSQQVNESLQTKLKDVLPDLSIAYVKENAEKIDPKNNGKDITLDELKAYKDTNISAVEKSLVQNAINNYDKYSQKDANDKNTPLGHMSSNELGNVLHQRAAQRQQGDSQNQPKTGEDLQKYMQEHKQIDSVKAGANLWKIATQELKNRGENAHDVKAINKEIHRIADLNHINDANLTIYKDKPLKLYDDKNSAQGQEKATGSSPDATSHLKHTVTKHESKAAQPATETEKPNQLKKTATTEMLSAPPQKQEQAQETQTASTANELKEKPATTSPAGKRETVRQPEAAQTGEQTDITPASGQNKGTGDKVMDTAVNGAEAIIGSSNNAEAVAALQKTMEQAKSINAQGPSEVAADMKQALIANGKDTQLRLREDHQGGYNLVDITDPSHPLAKISASGDVTSLVQGGAEKQQAKTDVQSQVQQTQVHDAGTQTNDTTATENKKTAGNPKVDALVAGIMSGDEGDESKQLSSMMAQAYAKHDGSEQALIAQVNNDVKASGYHVVEQKDHLGFGNKYVLRNETTYDQKTLSWTGKTEYDNEQAQKARDEKETVHQAQMMAEYQKEEARPKPQDASQMAAELASDKQFTATGKMSETSKKDLESLMAGHEDNMGSFNAELSAAMKDSGYAINLGYKNGLSGMHGNTEYEYDIKVVNANTNQIAANYQDRYDSAR